MEAEFNLNLMGVAGEKGVAQHTLLRFVIKVENIEEDSLDSIPPPRRHLPSNGEKVCLRCRGKILLGVVNKLLKTKSLLTSLSNVLPYYLK